MRLKEHPRCRGGKWKKSSIIKVLIILFGHLWEVKLTYRYIFVFKFMVANLPPMSLILLAFAAGVVDTGCKFATDVVDNGGAP